MASEAVKQRAYAIDPGCWVSYSGQPRNFKRSMDMRRTSALRQAAEELERERVFDTRPAFEIWWENYEPERPMDLKQIARDAWDASALS